MQDASVTPITTNKYKYVFSKIVNVVNPYKLRAVITSSQIDVSIKIFFHIYERKFSNNIMHSLDI